MFFCRLNHSGKKHLEYHITVKYWQYDISDTKKIKNKRSLKYLKNVGLALEEKRNPWVDLWRRNLVQTELAMFTGDTTGGHSFV